ncbi:hypothetical protein EV127DRAFT_449632 [Xylaria flabelliformis]|nr:hypothetical protein EV127DRAFT_449632 [Xylaria flabelliformis]
MASPVLKGAVSTTLATATKQSNGAASTNMRLVADKSRKAVEWAAANPGKTAAIGAGAVLIAVPMAAVAPVLGVAGFGANGVIAGSAAAAVQSSIGSVGAGSLFATLTSAGAGGYGVAAASACAQAVGAGVASAGVLSLFGKKKNQENEDMSAEKSEERVLNENDKGDDSSDTEKAHL